MRDYNRRLTSKLLQVRQPYATASLGSGYSAGSAPGTAPPHESAPSLRVVYAPPVDAAAERCSFC